MHLQVSKVPGFLFKASLRRYSGQELSLISGFEMNEVGGKKCIFQEYYTK